MISTWLNVLKTATSVWYPSSPSVKIRPISRLAYTALAWGGVQAFYLTLVILACSGCDNLLQPSLSPTSSPVVNANPPAPCEGVDPGGIPNIGNSCYMNAVLQIFKALYPSAFEAALSNDPANVVAQAGKAIMDKIKDDQAPATREEAAAFRAAIASPQGLDWPVGQEQRCASALFDQLIDRLNLLVHIPILATKI